MKECCRKAFEKGKKEGVEIGHSKGFQEGVEYHRRKQEERIKELKPKMEIEAGTIIFNKLMTARAEARQQEQERILEIIEKHIEDCEPHNCCGDEILDLIAPTLCEKCGKNPVAYKGYKHCAECRSKQATINRKGNPRHTQPSQSGQKGRKGAGE